MNLMIERFYIENAFPIQLQLTMPKETKKQVKKVFPLQTTMQSNAYKQQLKRQGDVLHVGADVRLQQITQQETIPTYLNIFRKNYDGLNQTHQLDELEVNQYSYDQKAKRDRHFNMKKEGEKKDTNEFPLTANQQYGWRQPVDDVTVHGMKQQFDQKLFMTLKSLKQAKK